MKFIETVKKYSIAMIIVSFLLGLVFTVFPQQSKDFISTIIGVSLIVFGVLEIIRFFRADRFAGSIVTGIITIVLGIVICTGKIQILNLIIGVLGVLLIIFGGFNLVVAIRLVASSGIFGWLTMLLSAASIVLGFIAAANTNETTVTIFRLLGIALIIYAVLDTISYFEVKNFVKKTADTVDSVLNDDDIETTGTIIDDKDKK